MALYIGLHGEAPRYPADLITPFAAAISDPPLLARDYKSREVAQSPIYVIMHSSDLLQERPHFSTFVRKITLIIDISSIPFL